MPDWGDILKEINLTALGHAQASQGAMDVVRRKYLHQLAVDGINRPPHAFRNPLHVDISGRRRARVSQHTLHVFHRSLLLRQGCNRSPNYLECELRKLQLAG